MRRKGEYFLFLYFYKMGGGMFTVGVQKFEPDVVRRFFLRKILKAIFYRKPIARREKHGYYNRGFNSYFL